MDGANSDKKIKKVARNKKRKGMELCDAETSGVVVSTNPDDVNEGKNSAGMNDTKKNKLKKKKSNKEKNKEAGVREYVWHSNVVGDDSNLQNDNEDGANSEKKMKKGAKNKKRKGTGLPEAETTEMLVSSRTTYVNEDKKRNKLKKKKRNKQKRKEDGVRDHVQHSDEVGDNPNQHSGKSKSLSQIENNATLLNNEDEVYQISSGDDDETTGMKRWITEYHQARPGADVLLERINDYLVDYWAQKEKERKEREAEAAEGGWTVVTHVKGRKKTTDAESGTTMGSVAQAAVVDKMSKKKNKQVGLNFYRFQRREAQRNEIMMLQSKFEQDKKRIQQMRAERKFRPY